MTNRQSNWQFIFHSIVLHPAEPRILMLVGESGWHLPAARFELGDAGPMLPPIHRLALELQSTLGVYTTVLRCVNRTASRDTHEIESIYVLENHSPRWTPRPNARWIDRNELASINLALPDQRHSIESYLAEAESGRTPESRAPWQRPGWIKPAIMWIQGTLSSQGFTPTAPVEQVRNWEISCILRARTNRGDVYFKQAADLPLFANEPLVTDALADLYPSSIPKPIAVDPSRGWMLLPDLGQIMSSNADESEKERALVEFGKVQIDSAERINELIAKGCFDRRLYVLESQIDDVIRDSMTLSSLNPLEVMQLNALAPRFKEMCRELADFNVPHTLVHGDLNTGNIAINGDSYAFFDWTDSCIAHPFFDIITMLGPKISSEQARPFQAYMSLWERYEPRERLMRAWTLARTLGILHQVVSYQSMQANLDAMSTNELAGASAYWTRRAIQSVMR